MLNRRCLCHPICTRGRSVLSCCWGVCIPLFSFSVRIGWPAEGEIAWPLAVGVVLVAGVIGAPFGWWFGPRQSPQRTSVHVVRIGIGVVLVGSLFALGESAPLLLGIGGAFAIGGAIGTAVGVTMIGSSGASTR